MTDGLSDQLRRMFDEITAVAVCLRQSTAVAHGSRGLSPAARAVLELLERQQSLTVPQLARRRGTSRQNLQVLVDRLIGAGLVEGVANPDHRRSERLRLTSAGKRSLNAANRRRAGLLGQLAPHLTVEEVRPCVEVLQRVRNQLGVRKRVGSAVGDEVSRPGLQDKAAAARPAVKRSVEPVQEPTVDASPPEELPVSLL